MSYKIIDEPKAKSWEHLIVDPAVILLVAIFIPLFWTPPYMGRFWIPFAWLIFNGFLLGSPSFIKETLVAIASIAISLGLVFATATISTQSLSENSFVAYARIIIFATFFLLLYLVVFIQTKPYQVFNYIKGQKNES